MIKTIKAKDFKGISEFEQPLGRLNLIVGPNGSGKSARSQALALLVQGYITGIGKTNQAIHTACAAPGVEKIFVQAKTANKTEFLKRYAKKSDTDSVSCDLCINGRKATPAQWAAEMERAGGMAVMDLTAFMILSDRKKIDEIFALFPPERGLKHLEEQIEQTKAELNRQQAKMRDNEKLAARLAEAKSSMTRHPGTMAEIQSQIETLESELEKTRQGAQEMAVADAAAKAREDAEKKLNANAQEQSQTAKIQEFPEKPEVATTNPSPAVDRTGGLPDPVTSLQTILSVLERSGCVACAAVLACKREIRKFKATPQAHVAAERMVANG